MIVVVDIIVISLYSAFIAMLCTKVSQVFVQAKKLCVVGIIMAVLF